MYNVISCNNWAFIIPYVVMLFLCGIPLLFLEFSIGQYMRLGPVHAMAKICPLLKGVGVATVVISFLLCTYYNVIIAWALYYLFSSFQSTLPWQNCNNTWNVPENCSSGFTGNATHLQSASQQFFDRRVLQMSGGVDQPGQIRWELLGLLILAWIIVYLCIFKGIKSTGKVVYFTAIFPYFILIALFINNVQLPGAKDGILYFLTPRWDKLLEVQSTLPWQNCNNTWNVPENCSSGFTGNATHLQSASQQFFDRRVLQMSGGVDQPGQIRWELLGLLILAWIIVYLCIFKGIKSTGKVVYFTAIFPYFILIALFINNVQLPGAKDGILYFLTPRWDKLLEVQVWVNAAAQIFNSIGIGFGSMISMASYNKFNNNILRDTLIVTLTNSATSIFAGLVIFSAIGYMAHIHHLPVDNIATDGPGLVFVVYPEAFVTMPVSPMWAALFFFMLLCLGLDSQFAMVEVMVTSLMDGCGKQLLRVLKRKELLVLAVCLVAFLLGIPNVTQFAMVEVMVTSLMDGCGKQLLRVLKRKELLVLAVCLVAFLLGIPNVTQGGIFFFQLLDHHTAVVSLMFLAFFEVVAICWIFGVKRLTRIVTEMLGAPPNMFFKVCCIVQYSPARYGKTYTYPPWAEVLGWFFSLCSIIWIPLGAVHTLYYSEVLGWFFSLCSIIWIPLGAVHTLYYSEGTLLQRLKSSIIPLDELASMDDLPVKTLANSSRSLSLHMIPEEVPLGREDVG
ncbi:UNVERIFIED_CONTAM: hypothetical protein FKN15_052117 [Acipenser sinensis]